ncbi:MAG: deoxyribonuclease IV [Patescibacteria group bacterium]
MSRKVGAHVSAAGGIDKAIERAHSIGANCVQIFSASPRVWQKPKLESFDTEKFFKAQKEFEVQPVVTHALYLINLASNVPAQVEKSIKALTFELSFDSFIKGSGVVVHLGSHQGRGWEADKEQVARGIEIVLKNTPENSTFLIENSAGQNGKLTTNLADIRWLMDQIKSSRLGWCFDTCHAFSAGYQLNPKSSVTEGAIGIIEEKIEKFKLWSQLKCIHVNDSRDPFASHKDRHDNLGEGSIPTEDFAHFLNLEQLKKLPLILEVPGIDGEGPDAENIKRLKALIHD